jgi:hypothetical protein
MSDPMLEKRLLKIKRDLEDVRTRKAQAEGRKQSALERLQKEHGCSNVKEAEKKAATLRKEIDNGNTVLTGMLKKLEEDYAWPQD